MTIEAQNPLKERWEAGGPSVGTWCEIPDPFVAEIVARAGFEWICVDWQHGLVGFESLMRVVHAISAAGTVPLVRVPVNAEWAIQKALDIGAFGVIVPLVSSPEDAARAAAACRFPPVGIRSYGPIRASRVIGDDPGGINAGVLCIPMIETVAGVETIEQIASTPGVDALIIGPYDMSLSMQLPLGSDQIQPSIDRILAAGQAAGIPVGRHFDSGDAARAGFAQGFSFIAVGTDRELLATAAVATAEAAWPTRPARPDPRSIVVRAVATSADD